MAKAKKNAIQKVNPEIPVCLDDIQKDALAGGSFDNITTQDIAIPFITILQSNSPQIAGTKAVKGALPGQFFHNVRNEILGDEIKVVLCNFKRLYVEWKSRDAGGGFVKYHYTSDILDQTTKNPVNNQDILPNGNYIANTCYHFVMLLGESPEPGIIALSSTQLKHSKKWLSQARTLTMDIQGKKVTPPLFSQIYTVKSVYESNNKGNWFGWSFSSPVMIEDIDLYNTSKEYFRLIQEDKALFTPPSDNDSADNDNDEYELAF